MNPQTIAIVSLDELHQDRILQVLKYYPHNQRVAFVLIGCPQKSPRVSHIPIIPTETELEGGGLYRADSLDSIQPDLVVLASMDDSTKQTNHSKLYWGTSSFWISTDDHEVGICDWLDLSDCSFSYLSRNTAAQENCSMGIGYSTIADYLSSHGRSEILIDPPEGFVETLQYHDPSSHTIFLPAAKIPTICLGLETLKTDIWFLIILNKLRYLERILQENRHDQKKLKLIPPNPDKESYNLFARYYDSYMSHVDYDSWTDSIKIWFEKYSSRKLNKILEIACGTASISSRFVKESYDVSASDSSPYMLHMADHKPHKPKLYYGDLLDPIPEKGYDLIICLFDSINYLLHTSEIYKCLINVHEALQTGGLFIFDISTLANSLDNFYDEITYTSNRDGNIVHEAFYDEVSKRQISKLSFYLKFGHVHRKFVEEHVQKVYRGYEIVNIINSSPLQLVALHSQNYKANLYNRRNGDLDKTHHRLFYVLRKED